MAKSETSSNKATPKYLHIYEDILRKIQTGDLKPGDQLPSFSQLRASHQAMPATAERAYARLESENLVVRRARRGVYVAPREKSLTGNIGFVWHSLVQSPDPDSPYMHTLLSGVREGCQEFGVQLLLVDDSEAANPQKTDGLLLHCDKLEAYAMGIPAQVPYVLLARRAEGVTTVTSDDFGGGKLAVAHLIEKGHRRIACLMEEMLDEPTQRTAGYRVALQEAGIELDPRWLNHGKMIDWADITSYVDWGRRHMQAWLDSNWAELGCTAIFAQNDHTAIGVMQALQEAGIDVPGQVSVIGFDGISVCDMVRPRLTSIKVPLHQIGREAVKALCEQIQQGQPSTRNISLPVALRPGDSVADIN